MGEFLDIKEHEEFIGTLSRHLPSGTLPYFRWLFLHNENYSYTDEEIGVGFNPVYDQFSRFTSINASFKEIGDPNDINLDKKINCPGLEDCKLAQIFIESLKGARCA